MKNIKKINKGYTLLETIFYVLLFTILSIAVINSMITMTKAFEATAINSDLIEGGDIMEQMTRAVRQAYAIASISTSDLKLNTTDNSGNKETLEFLLSGANVELLTNNTLTGNLNASSVSVTSLTFTEITTAQGLAVKMFLTVESNHDPLARNENFYDTIVLRGDYS